MLCRGTFSPPGPFLYHFSRSYRTHIFRRADPPHGPRLLLSLLSRILVGCACPVACAAFVASLDGDPLPAERRLTQYDPVGDAHVLRPRALFPLPERRAGFVAHSASGSDCGWRRDVGFEFAGIPCACGRIHCENAFAPVAADAIGVLIRPGQVDLMEAGYVQKQQVSAAFAAERVSKSAVRPI